MLILIYSVFSKDIYRIRNYMKTFVADIIPSIQRFSRKLDDIALLTNQHWVVLDELNNSKTVYIFRQTGELLISTNGKVDKARWEYLGQDSILIDLKDDSYLFRHGFFDENILALKIDSKEEYAVMINETKFGKELNSISDVVSLLNQKYLVNPLEGTNNLEQRQSLVKERKFIRNGYNLRMGSFKQYLITFSNGKSDYVYFKISNEKYYIYESNRIFLFPDFDTYLAYKLKAIKE